MKYLMTDDFSVLLIAYFWFFLNYALYKKLKFESIKTILEQISYNVTYVYI